MADGTQKVSYEHMLGLRLLVLHHFENVMILLISTWSLKFSWKKLGSVSPACFILITKAINPIAVCIACQ